MPQDRTYNLESGTEAMPQALGGSIDAGIVQGVFKVNRIQSRAQNSKQAQAILKAVEIVRLTLLEDPVMKVLVEHDKINLEFWPDSSGIAGTFIYPADGSESLSIKAMRQAELTETCRKKVGITCSIGFNFGEGEGQHETLKQVLGDDLKQQHGYVHTKDESFWAAALVHEIAVHIGPYISVIQKIADGDVSKLVSEDFKLLGAGGEQVEHRHIHESAAGFQATMYGKLLAATATKHAEYDFENDDAADAAWLEEEAYSDMYHQYALADVARYDQYGKPIGEASKIQANYIRLWDTYVRSKPKSGPKPSVSSGAAASSTAQSEVKRSSTAPSLSSASQGVASAGPFEADRDNFPPLDPSYMDFLTMDDQTGFLVTDHDGWYEKLAAEGKVWKVLLKDLDKRFAASEVQRMGKIGVERFQDVKGGIWNIRHSSDRHQCHYFEKAT